MNRIRKGDEVIVTTGKDKGRSGKVLSVISSRVTIEGVNLVKKHLKPNPMKDRTGGLEEKILSIHISNIAIVDSNGRASRIGIKINDGEKIRFLKSNGDFLSS